MRIRNTEWVSNHTIRNTDADTVRNTECVSNHMIRNTDADTEYGMGLKSHDTDTDTEYGIRNGSQIT
jgi:hypothetical protein